MVKMSNFLIPTYNRLPVSFSKGEGAWLWDQSGKKYLDALSGIAVCGLGHTHPVVTSAIAEQAGKLIHTSNLYQIEKQEIAADALCQLSGMTSVFFCNSGAEANEAAIKLARLHGNRKGYEQPNIIVMQSSFHGRTMGALSATGNVKAQNGFSPLLPGFIRVPYDDIDAIHEAATRPNNQIVAILVEPIQGEGGIVLPSETYLQQLRVLCDEKDWLLMLDEIQTGMGRTGEFFAHQHSAITPDVMTLAKALGNGVPIGACLVNNKANELFQPGHHGSTFGGNPLACAAAIAVIETLKNESLCQRATEMGEYLLTSLRKAFSGRPGVEEVRGKGLMLGIELTSPCSILVNRALEKGLLINVTAAKVIRLLPPLILNREEADQIVSTLTELVYDFLNEDEALHNRTLQ
jgi:acetylornithine aminotransferase